MIFNEILIPQDSFTETNVTRKKSVVEKSVIAFQKRFIEITTFNYMLENIG